MKPDYVKLNRLLTIAIAVLIFLSCGKEYSYEGGLSTGSLKEDAAGSYLFFVNLF